MTPKQEERLKSKILKLKKALAADKKYWGGYYHDGKGLRYAIPKYYIQLEDFSGGLRYFNWFNKNFPDDIGFPDFLFEWTIILFKTGRKKEAQRKAFETFTRNTYLFDKFFGREIIKITKSENSNLEVAEFAKDYFYYSNNQENLYDFAEWLMEVTQSEKFLTLMNRFIEIQVELEKENDYKTRKKLIEQAYTLENEF
jgi:tetratricopeptide (TPR) repeat protein